MKTNKQSLAKLKFGKEWHEVNRMPKNPNLEQRITWHVLHAKSCSCRPIPGKLMEEIKKTGLRYNQN